MDSRSFREIRAQLSLNKSNVTRDLSQITQRAKITNCSVFRKLKANFADISVFCKVCKIAKVTDSANLSG